MPQQKPLTPFVSTDPRFAPEPTPQPQEPPEDECEDNDPHYCECNMEFTFDELDANKCDHCGKVIIP